MIVDRGLLNRGDQQAEVQCRVQTFEDAPLSLYYCLPAKAVRPDHVLVSVHGISRNARQHVALLKNYARETGALVVAPYFSRRDYRDYQRLGYRRSIERADLALIDALDLLFANLSISPTAFSLFGYSGGAQFAHRFAMLYPEKVSALYLGAAGCYTFPDPSVAYPYGLARVKDIFGREFQLPAFLQIPTTILVGADDSQRDHSLNTLSQVDAQQGLHRIERARRWMDALQFFAYREGIDSHLSLQVIPGCGHAMRELVRSEIFGKALKS